MGGPPCQAFARVGRSKLREVADHPEAFRHDPRARLYIDYLQYVEACVPLAVLMENVPDMMNHGGHNIAEEVCEVLESRGYVSGYTLLNAAYYGVPQMRERMFLIASRKELVDDISFPAPTHWIELPPGYEGSRAVAMKLLARNRDDARPTRYRAPPEASSKLPHAVSVKQAIGDLPPIFAQALLRDGTLQRGARRFDTPIAHGRQSDISDFARQMREWPGFEAATVLNDHVIRYLPRDYALFARLDPGDQYPQAIRHAEALFEEKLARERKAGRNHREASAEWEALRAATVPPYDVGKFPNKWRKMEADQPARTLLAHLGKDSYSHIHYDNAQARTISVREAARLQSFPDEIHLQRHNESGIPSDRQCSAPTSGKGGCRSAPCPAQDRSIQRRARQTGRWEQVMSDGDLPEIIVVRSLTDSDLGLFSAHRASATSKQRAININAPIAQQMLSPAVFAQGGTVLDCTCTYHGITDRGQRHFGKVGKNWRLGGNKIEGEPSATLDSKDFVLIRTVAGNDGSQPIRMSFVGRANDRVAHAGIVAIVQNGLDRSMAAYPQGSETFRALASFVSSEAQPAKQVVAATPGPRATRITIQPMPREAIRVDGKMKTVHDKLRSPHILEQMLKVAGDLSAPAQLRFFDTIEQLASQLRVVLLETGGIVKVPKNHRATWDMVAGKEIGFIDGGLANLSMLGSAPIAARVGGYVVRPGDYSADRERFIMLKRLIDELYSPPDGGVYDDSFPDLGALRDAARISIEAAGAVRVISECPEIAWVFTHGALVNPVSRYTDEMRDGKVRHSFPNFSPSALHELLPPDEPARTGRDANFISVHLRQLEIMNASSAVVCEVIERPATTYPSVMPSSQP